MPETQAEIRARLRAEILAIEQAGAVGSRKTAVVGGTTANPEGLAARPQGPSSSPVATTETRSEEAFQRIVRLASRKELPSVSLRERLAREGFDSQDIEASMVRAIECGLVDDSRYAEVLVRSRVSQGKGRRGIEAELERLGIELEGVAAVFGESGLDEVQRALALLKRKPPQAKNQRAAAYRKLMQKGYDSETAMTAARLWCEERDSHEQAQADAPDGVYEPSGVC